MRLLALAWTVAIIAACSIPGADLPEVDLASADKLVHFSLFLIFGALWMAAGTQPLRRRAVIVLLFGLVFAVGTEFYQGLLPFDRTPDLFDALANTAGLLLGVGGFVVWQRRQRRA